MSAYLQQQVHDLKIRVRKLEHIKELEECSGKEERKYLREEHEREIRKLEDGP